MYGQQGATSPVDGRSDTMEMANGESVETRPTTKEYHQLPPIAVLPQPHWASQAEAVGGGNWGKSGCVL